MTSSSTSRFADKYLSNHLTGAGAVHPASAALINTNGLGVSAEEEDFEVKHSMAVIPNDGEDEKENSGTVHE